MKKIYLLFLLVPFLGYSQDDSIANVINMSIEELLNLEVKTSSITGLKQQAIPASITTITRRDLDNTAARNIYDLIEMFVPGATWANHYDGPHMGIRFAPSDRNYKYLLLVNGVNLNQKSLNGACTELENWDMGDIEKIEIIRGPGSVTFGPGAIQGVINIITRQAHNSPTVMASTSYVYPYRSYGGNAQYTVRSKNISIVSYASVTQLGGYENANMLRVEKTPGNTYSVGYIGKGQQYAAGKMVGDAPPLTYMRSRIPQMKFHLGGTIGKEWEFMVRYTSSDVNSQYVYPQVRNVKDVTLLTTTTSPGGITSRTGEIDWGEYRDYGFVKHHVASAMIKNTHDIMHRLKMQSKLTAYSHDYDFGWNDYYFSHAFSFDSVYKYHELGSLTDPQKSFVETGRNWSENELNASEIFTWSPTPNSKYAAGAEWTITSIQKGWGDSRSEMIAGESWDFFADTNSIYIRKDANKLAQNSTFAKNATFIGKRFVTHTLSVVSEANIMLTRDITLLLSGRIDKNQYIKWLMSPRVALIVEMHKDHYLKFIAQQSQRMNTTNQLYFIKKKQASSSSSSNNKVITSLPVDIPLQTSFIQENGSDNENLTSFEIIYSYFKGQTINVNIPLYYNIVDNLGLDRGNDETPTISTYRIGRFSCVGFEPEVKISLKRCDLGMNHSYYIPLRWNLTKREGGQRNVTSVGDWNYSVTYGDQDVQLTSNTANLMLWSNQTTKLWSNIKLLKNKLTVNVNTQFFWNYEGGKDMLAMYKNAAAGTSQEAAMNQLVDDLEARNVFGTEVKLNAGVNYQATKNLLASLSVMNIAGVGKARRYTLWEFWNDYPNPAFVEEPRAFFVKLRYTIQ